MLCIFFLFTLLEDCLYYFNNVHAGEPVKQGDNEYAEADNHGDVHKNTVERSTTFFS